MEEREDGKEEGRRDRASENLSSAAFERGDRKEGEKKNLLFFVCVCLSRKKA